VYLDAAYIVKLYLNEPESATVENLARRADRLCTSALSIAEVNCVFLRAMRMGRLSREECLNASSLFAQHLDEGFWETVPVSSKLLLRTGTMLISEPNIFLRAGDAIHLLTAQDLGEREIWTGDRQMLAAAPYFGLIGRSV
jgi:predicted nucleic acid-binding protein